MSKALLLHGTGGSNTDYYWFEDIKMFLEENGYEVWWPQLPNTENPELLETEDYIIDNWPNIDDNTVLIGHSSSCPVILHILQNQQITVDKVILVGGFYEPIDEGRSNRMLPKNGFDWSEIRSKAREIIMINSDNDPWGCTDEKVRNAAIELGAKLILNAGEGHMGTSRFNQPYREFELLKRLLAVQYK